MLKGDIERALSAIGHLWMYDQRSIKCTFLSENCYTSFLMLVL